MGISFLIYAFFIYFHVLRKAIRAKTREGSKILYLFLLALGNNVYFTRNWEISSKRNRSVAGRQP
jgi:hypothetical protein